MINYIFTAINSGGNVVKRTPGAAVNSEVASASAQTLRLVLERLDRFARDAHLECDAVRITADIAL